MMRKLPDLDQITAFMAVAEELSFKRAAQRLAIDASALSRRIKDLEARLGFPLLFRTTQVVELTEAGKRFYEGNQHLVGSLRETIAAAARVARGSVGHLRVGYMTFAGLDLLPRTVSRYRNQYPEVAISLTYMPTQDQKFALARNEIDIGLMLGPFQHPKFEILSLIVECFFIAIPKAHPLSESAQIRPNQLVDEPIILGTDRHWDFYRTCVEGALRHYGVELNIEVEASNMLGILGLVKAGVGMTIVPRTLIDYCPSGVVMRPLTACDAVIETIAVWRRPADAKLEQFLSLLQQQARLHGSI